MQYLVSRDDRRIGHAYPLRAYHVDDVGIEQEHIATLGYDCFVAHCDLALAR